MYLIEESIFSQSLETYYKFNLCPGFWHALAKLNQQGICFSVRQVETALKALEHQPLSAWIRYYGAGFFKVVGEAQLTNLAAVAEWANREFEPAIAAGFLGSSNLMLTAYALEENATIVTQDAGFETGERLKLSTVCSNFSLDYMSLFEFLEREEVHLSTAA